MAEQVQQKKPSIIRKFVRFVRDIRSELKKVIWPTKSQLINNTITVIATCILLGAVIWIVDAVFGFIYSLVFA